MRYRSLLLAAAASAALGASATATAQTPTQADQSSTNSARGTDDNPADPRTIAAAADHDEILVTAQRRAESAQRVPISLTALPAEQLVRTNISSIQDLGRVAPSFNAFRSAQAANTRLSIRGIGSPGNAAIEPSVGAFVDGIYIPRPGPLLAGLNDISSIEILRGPQGTLFGRNASVGAISIHTAEPTADSEGAGTLEVGNYGRIRAKALLNLPVSATTATRFAALYDRFEGYGYDLLRGERVGDNTTFSLRGAVRSELTPTLTWLLRGDYQRQRGDGISPTTVDASTVTPTFAANFAARLNGLTPILNSTYGYSLRQISIGRLRDSQGGIASDLSLALGDTTLRLLSGWRDWHNRQSEADIPFTRAALLGRDAEYRSKSHSEELQLISPEDRSLTVVSGLYYFRERYDTDTIINLGRDYCNIYIRNTTPARVAACLSGPQVNAGRFTFDQVTQSYAAYGQATYKVLPAWDVTLGLRYSHDDKEAGLLSVAPNSTLGALNAPDSADLTFEGGRLTYRANTTFRPSSDVMVFATVSSGYKSGGFDTGSGNTLGNNRVFQPELVTNYEIGAKTQFFNRRLTLNATAFRMDVDDFQLRSFNGTFYVVRNAGSIRQQGVEFDVIGRPTPDLTLSLSGTRLASKYTDFKNAPPRPGLTAVQDLTGTRVSYSPKWQGTAAVDYRRTLTGGYEVGLNTHLGFTSDIDVGIAGDGNPQGVQDGYALLGARLSVALPGDRWELALLGENLTDKGFCVTKYGQTLAGGLGLAAAGSTVLRCALGEPRTIRGSLTFRF